MIRFEDHENFFELDLTEQKTKASAPNEDSYITIKLSSNGYAGQNDLWVTNQSLRNFCCQLLSLEKERKGEAILESLSPGELHLQVFSIDSLGHMGLRGSTGFQVSKGTDLFPHSVTFGFEFGSSQLETATEVEWVSFLGDDQNFRIGK